MKAHEDLARLKVQDAVRNGLEASRRRPADGMTQPPDLSLLTTVRRARRAEVGDRGGTDLSAWFGRQRSRLMAAVRLFARSLLRGT